MLLKEFRELASFVLNLVDDNLVLMQNSGLSMSPTANLGKERVSAIQLSSIFVVILITIYIKTLSTAPTKIDLLAFSAVCVAYFAIASFIVGRAMASQEGSEPGAETSGRDVRLDSTSYVLFFNTIALLVFAIARDVLFFYLGRESLGLANVTAAIVAAAAACGSILYMKAGASGKGSSLTGRQKLFITGAMTATFVIYSVIVTRWQ